MKDNVILGINISCVGDNGPYSYVSSRKGDTYADKIIKKFISTKNNYINYGYLKHRGSDERQYCMPKIDLPLITFSRSKFGKWSISFAKRN